MGDFLIIPHRLHDKINKLPGNAFQIYLMLLRCVNFQPYSRKPATGSDFFVYPYSKAKRNCYAGSKRQFFRGIQRLIDLKYVEIIRAGYFQGEKAFRQQTLYRLLIF
jgi:hypothetical protein